MTNLLEIGDRATKITFPPGVWCALLGVEIIDPDGWDRTAGNFQQDWAKSLTFDEFMDKADESTVFMMRSRKDLRKLAKRKLVKMLNIVENS